MSQFVNPQKRGFLLPDGCKDLIDVLRGPPTEHLPNARSEEMIRSLIQLILFEAQQYQAAELVIGVPAADGVLPIRYKVENSWYDIGPFPSGVRGELLAELSKMALLPDGEFPKQGVLDLTFAGERHCWIVNLTSPDGLCTLVRAEDH